MSPVKKSKGRKEGSVQSRTPANKTKAKKWKQKGNNVKLTAGKSTTNPESRKPSTTTTTQNPVETKNSGDSLRDRMLKRLDAARFRLVNEELDSMGAGDSNPLAAFGSSLDQFQKYHESYSERVRNWPSDPLNIIVRFIKKKIPNDKIIADFGCGEARLAASIPHKVHSFDLFALNDRVTACDMSSTPLKSQSVDVAVFCLSLMGTEVSKYIAEASRVLKIKGILKIAEVSSRFPENYQSSFVKRLKKFGFVPRDKQVVRDVRKKVNKDDVKREEVFLMFEFLKIRAMKDMKGKLPVVRLSPCMYKKR